MKRLINISILTILLGTIVSCQSSDSSDDSYEKQREKERKEQQIEQQREQSRLDSLNFYLNIADSLHENRKTRLAIAYLDSSLHYALKEKIELSAKQGGWCFEARVYNKAIESYTTTIESNYDLQNTYYSRALCYEKLRERQLAVDDLKKAVGLGNDEASELHERINPERKRISYYVTRCCDGSTSSAKGRGACSHHGGVCNWNDPVYESFRKY